MNVTQARAKVARFPGKYRAALIEDDGVPMKRSARVVLYEKVGDADAAFKARAEEVEGDGYLKTWGSVSRGFLRFEHVDSGDEVALTIDKPTRHPIAP